MFHLTAPLTTNSFYQIFQVSFFFIKDGNRQHDNKSHLIPLHWYLTGNTEKIELAHLLKWITIGPWLPVSCLFNLISPSPFPSLPLSLSFSFPLILLFSFSFLFFSFPLSSFLFFLFPLFFLLILATDFSQSFTGWRLHG